MLIDFDPEISSLRIYSEKKKSKEEKNKLGRVKKAKKIGK